jgi:hypothetical protein
MPPLCVSRFLCVDHMARLRYDLTIDSSFAQEIVSYLITCLWCNIDFYGEISWRACVLRSYDFILTTIFLYLANGFVCSPHELKIGRTTCFARPGKKQVAFLHRHNQRLAFIKVHQFPLPVVESFFIKFGSIDPLRKSGTGKKCTCVHCTFDHKCIDPGGLSQGVYSSS